MIFKIGKDVFIESSTVAMVTDYSKKSVIAKIKELKAEKKVLDITSGRKILGVVFLKNGEVIITDTSFRTIIKKLNAKENMDEEEQI